MYNSTCITFQRCVKLNFQILQFQEYKRPPQKTPFCCSPSTCNSLHLELTWSHPPHYFPQIITLSKNLESDNSNTGSGRDNRLDVGSSIETEPESEHTHRTTIEEGFDLPIRVWRSQSAGLGNLSGCGSQEKIIPLDSITRLVRVKVSHNG